MVQRKTGGAEPVSLSVSLVASPTSATTTDTLTLTCTVVEGGEAETLTIDQLSGPFVALMEESAGVSTATFSEADVYTFRCVGESAGGTISDPATLTVSILAPSDDGDGRGDDGRGGR